MRRKGTMRPWMGTLLALALAAAPAAAPAQVKKVDELKYPPLPRFNVPSPTRVELDNGMVVILLEDHELPLIDATVRVRTGARLEPQELIGVAQITGSVMRTGGTKTMTGDELDDFLEGKAARVETFIGDEFGGASMSCLKGDFPEVLKVFADVLRNPVFAQDKIDITKNQANAGIARQNDNPQSILFREFQEIIYGADSPYAWSETYATIARITRDDLVAWHKKHYHPNRIVLGLAGDFDTAQALELVKATFGDWAKGAAPEKVDVAYNKQVKPGVYYIEKNDMTQSNIAMGHLGIVRNNPDYYAVEVLNQIMSGSFASRLFSNVRSKKGLAYAVRGTVNSDWDHHGIFQMWMTTKTETTGAGIEALLEEARNLTALPPTDEEVAKAKMGILNSFIFNSDSSGKILSQQVTYEYYGYPLDWLTRYRNGIEKVTTAQVREVAAKYVHPDQMAILVVGPKEGQDKPLSTYGTVTAVDITIPEPPTARAEVTDETKKAGAALLARAVDAFGGAAKVDAVESSLQKASAALKTPQGEIEVKMSALMAFPDRLRQEVVLPFGTMTTVITPDDAFLLTPGGTQPVPDSRRADALRDMRRNPMVILKARKQPALVAAVVGQEEVGGKTLQTVQVEWMGDVTLLGVDPETGRILKVAYEGPHPMSGARGEIVQMLSDYRDAGGVTVPFRVEASFNGEPFMTATTESVEINKPVAADAFARPEPVTAQKDGQ